MSIRDNGRSKQVVYLAIGLSLLVPILLPLLVFDYPTHWDTESHLIRMAAFHQALLDGQIPPRWITHLAFGWGSPVLMFNWSLPYYLAEPFIFAGISVLTSFKLVLFIGIMASFFTMYFFLKSWFSPLAALVGALVYNWSIYRINTLYIRGAIGEATAFIFWPLILSSTLLIAKGKIVTGIVLGSFSFALLMLSHQVMFLMILPLWLGFVFLTTISVVRVARKKQDARGGLSFRSNVTAWAIETLWRDRGLDLDGARTRQADTSAGGPAAKKVLANFFSLGIGLGLSAFFWLPALLLKSDLAMSKINVTYDLYFSSLPALLSQPGFFAPPVGSFFLLYPIGWPQLIIVVTGILAVLGKTGRTSVKYNVFLGFSFLICVYLLLPASTWVWQTMPLLSEFIYPLRFIGLLTFIAAVMAGMVVASAGKQKLLIGSLIVILALVLSFPATQVGGERIKRDNAWFFTSDKTTDVMGEFLPKGAERDFADHPEIYRSWPALSVLSGQGRLSELRSQTASVSFTARGDTPLTVMIKQFYFPGWLLTGNGQPLTVEIGRNGNMIIRLPAGLTTVSARFTGTTIVTLANLITLATAFVGLYLLISTRLRLLR